MKHILENINDPMVQSVLYDMDLLPEQIDVMRGDIRKLNIRRMKMVCKILSSVQTLEKILDRCNNVIDAQKDLVRELRLYRIKGRNARANYEYFNKLDEKTDELIQDINKVLQDLRIENKDHE